MRKKIIASAIVMSIVVATVGTNVAKAAEEDTVDIKRVVNQYLYADAGISSDVIEMYEEAGWVYNPVENYFLRSVAYQNAPLVVDGCEYTTDQNGEIELDDDDSVINIESLSGRDGPASRFSTN